MLLKKSKVIPGIIVKFVRIRLNEDERKIDCSYNCEYNKISKCCLGAIFCGKYAVNPGLSSAVIKSLKYFYLPK